MVRDLLQPLFIFNLRNEIKYVIQMHLIHETISMFYMLFRCKSLTSINFNFLFFYYNINNYFFTQPLLPLNDSLI